MLGLEAPSFKARHQRTGSGNLLRSVLPHLQSEQQLPQGHTANGRGYGPMAQIKVTSANLTRWVQLATGSGDGGAIDRNSLDLSCSSKSVPGMEGLYAGGMEKSSATGVSATGMTHSGMAHPAAHAAPHWTRVRW
jgi:hypothetical protein